MKKSFKTWLLEADDEYTKGVKDLYRAFVGGKTKPTLKQVGRGDKMEKYNRTFVVRDVQKFIDNLFTKFPYHESGAELEKMLETHTSYDAAKDMFTFFKNSANSIERMRLSMNKTLVSQKKITQIQQKTINSQSQKSANSIPDQLIPFVKKEADFFKRLFNISPSEFEIDKANFTQLLSAKIKSTASGRVYDAAMALNILFIYLNKEFSAMAKVVGAAAEKRKQEKEKSEQGDDKSDNNGKTGV